MKVKFIAMILFLGISISNLGVWFGPVLNASSIAGNIDEAVELSGDEVLNAYLDGKISQAEYESTLPVKQQRFVCAGICAGIAIGVGTAAAVAIMTLIAQMGTNYACQRDEHRRGYDYYCDAFPAFRDYGLNGNRY